MWSRRFLWVGIGTSLLVASLAVSCIWLVMRVALSLTVQSDLANHAVFCTVGILVYPVMWVLLVYARHSYTRATTYGLIGATYLVSCAIVFAIFLQIGQSVADDIVLAQRTHGRTIFAENIPNPRVIYGRFAVGGAILFLLPFAAIGGPLAFVHRRVLLAGPAYAETRTAPTGGYVQHY